MRRFVGPKQIDREVSILYQASVRRESGQLLSQQFWPHCRGKRLLSVEREPRTHDGSPGILALASMPEQIGAPAQICGSLTIVFDARNALIGNLAAHANFNGFSLLLQKLLCQQRRAKPGMEHSKNLKADAVV